MSRMPKQETVELKHGYDASAERTVIGTLIKHGIDVFYDIDSVVKDHSFYLGENKFLYSAIRKLIIEDKVNKPSIASIVATCNSLDTSLSNRYQITEYASALVDVAIAPNEITPFCNTVQKFALIRGLQDKLLGAAEYLSKTDGAQSMSEIIGLAEKPINDFTDSLLNETDIITIGDNLSDYLKYLSDTKPAVKGIPSGYPMYDKYLGNGLRTGVHLIGARSGVGKSFMCINISKNVTALGIPVLYLDTELTDKMTMERWASLVSGIEIDKIETGKFDFNNPIIQKTIKSKSNTLFDYFNISGRQHHEWLSIARRWLMKKVGFNANGTTKPCLIILDYIKTMDLRTLGDFAEYQYLGQVITDLHNFCLKFDFPMVSAVQLNRDGIGREDQGVVAGSDRLISLCSSFTILKNKSPEDFAADPPTNGDKKLVIAKSRFGPGTGDGEYINLVTDLSRASIVENGTNRSTKGPAVTLEESPDEDDDIGI